MLTKLLIRNFKRFAAAEIPLASPVVFIGPNNCGKTTALQALSLWELGLRRWKEKRSDRASPEKRPGVAINRRDLLAVPVPAANALWRDVRVRNPLRPNAKLRSPNILIDVLVEGISDGKEWRCGLEFDFANVESFYCRPLRLQDEKDPPRMPIPDEAYGVEIAFLPPMSGLLSNETRLDTGAVNVRLGEGRTAEVLRNLCYQLSTAEDRKRWDWVSQQIRELFQVELADPEYVVERGEIQMAYRDCVSRVSLDLSCSGRGLQQTLLLLAYISLHPGAVLLLDEPDAHLEILRQRDIYWILSEAARNGGGQLIAASHSEVIMDEAAGGSPESVVAFLGQPHVLASGRTHAVRHALRDLRLEQYYLAEQTGWVLYLEDQTDLSVLRAFADHLNHPARVLLRSPFFHPVGNQPNRGRRHFDSLVEWKPDVMGFLLVDRDAPALQSRAILREMKWERREIENYICQPDTLEGFAREVGKGMSGGRLSDADAEARAVEAIRTAVQGRVAPDALRDEKDPWWINVKASDEFLDLVFPRFFQSLGLRIGLAKADYHRLVRHIPPRQVAPEVVTVLDAICQTAEAARPA